MATLEKKKDFQIHPPAKLQKRNKRNTVNGKAHSSERVSSNFDKGSPVLKKKSQKASHPLCFAKNVIIEFWKGTDNNVYSFLFHQVHLGQGIHEWTK